MIVERPVTSKPAEPPTATSLKPVAPPRAEAPEAATVPAHPISPSEHRVGRWQASHDLARPRAETERVKVLVDFLARPIHAHGGTDPDPDIVSAYNLAVEAALGGIRRAAQAIPG